MAGDDIASHYEVLEELGRGSFGVVYKGIERATGETVAIKHVSRTMRAQPFSLTSPVHLARMLKPKYRSTSSLARMTYRRSSRRSQCLALVQARSSPSTRPAS